MAVSKTSTDFPWQMLDEARAFIRKHEKREHPDLARIQALAEKMEAHQNDDEKILLQIANEIFAVLHPTKQETKLAVTAHEKTTLPICISTSPEAPKVKVPMPGNDALQITFSLVPSVKDTQPIHRRRIAWIDFVAKLENPKTWPRKEAMPLFKLVTFGNVPNPKGKGGLRHNANVLEVFGLVGEHDAGTVTLDEAAQRLQDAGIESALYTTPSHTPDKPRWRVVVPFSQSYPPTNHPRLMSLLNGALGGVLSSECWALSQVYYIGKVKGGEYHYRHVAGNPLDLLELVSSITPIDKPASRTAAPTAAGDGLTTLVLADDRKKALSKVSAETFNDLRAALAVIPNDAYATWIAMGQALASLNNTKFASTARDLYCEWSEKDYPKYDVDACLAKWDTFTADNTDYRAIFAEAKRHGWKNNKSHDIFTAPTIVPKVYTAEQLANMEIQPVRYIVDDLLLEGVFILAASPKVGKSWLTLQMACAIASGTEVLGKRVPTAGDVLLLALEDNNRRMKNRFEKLGLSFMSKDQSERIDICHEWPRVGAGGAELIEKWLKEHPHARLAVVDVLEQLRPARSTKANPYSEDYESLVALKSLATKYRVAIVVVHHTRKADSYDPLQLVSGTQGLTGAADGIMVLERPRGTSSGTLHIMARDLEHDGAFAVEFNDGQWSMVGPAGLVAAGTAQQAVLDALSDASEPMKRNEIAAEVGKKGDAVNHVLRKLIQQGKVVKLEYGKYDLAPALKEVGLAVAEGNDGRDLV